MKFNINTKKLKQEDVVYKYLRYVDQEFIDCIYDLVESEEVKELEKYTQHHTSTRLEHSLNVSYYSYKITKYMGYDYCAAARGGLLHDLYFHDWNGLDKSQSKLHLTRHPKISLAHAQKIADLSKKEKDIILKHMWPLTPTPPKYMESLITSLVDKYCAIIEGLGVKIGQEETIRTKAVMQALANYDFLEI